MDELTKRIKVLEEENRLIKEAFDEVMENHTETKVRLESLIELLEVRDVIQVEEVDIISSHLSEDM